MKAEADAAKFGCLPKVKDQRGGIIVHLLPLSQFTLPCVCCSQQIKTLWYGYSPTRIATSRHKADKTTQAHRIVTQVFVTGARVFGRAFAEAYRHASATQKYQAATGGAAAGPYRSRIGAEG